MSDYIVYIEVPSERGEPYRVLMLVKATGFGEASDLARRKLTVADNEKVTWTKVVTVDAMHTVS